MNNLIGAIYTKTCIYTKAVLYYTYSNNIVLKNILAFKIIDKILDKIIFEKISVNTYYISKLIKSYCTQVISFKNEIVGSERKLNINTMMNEI